MSTHIGAKPGEIAERVLMPGDPLRAKWIAETYLEGATCYSTVRGMLGFTGRWNGVEVSVQGSGMGMPSASIYTHELINEYGVKTLIRVGNEEYARANNSFGLTTRIQVPPDTETLKEIARVSKGRFYEAADSAKLEENACSPQVPGLTT